MEDRTLLTGWGATDFIVADPGSGDIDVFDENLVFRHNLDPDFPGVWGLDFTLDGNLIAAGRGEVRVYDSTGTVVSAIDTPVETPRDIKADAGTGEFYVAASDPDLGIVKFDADGNQLGNLGVGTTYTGLALVSDTELWAGSIEVFGAVHVLERTTGDLKSTIVLDGGQLSAGSMRQGSVFSADELTSTAFKRDTNGELNLAFPIPFTGFSLLGVTPAADGGVLTTAFRDSSVIPAFDADGNFVGFTDISANTSFPGNIIWAGLGTIVHEPPSAGLTLGDLVWNDENRNGRVDAGEQGIDGVRVELYLDSNGNNLIDQPGDEFVGSTTTSGAGQYTFSGLDRGDYIVVIPASNFSQGGALQDFVSTAVFNPVVPDPDNDVDNDNNGDPIVNADDVASKAVTLESGTEPTDDGDEDPNTHLALDFGFVSETPPPPEPPSSGLTLGDRVWLDEDANGLFEFSEGGIDGVVVELYEDSNGNGLFDFVGFPPDRFVAETTTSGNGFYSFGGLDPGDYIVHIAAINFLPGRALHNLRSTDVFNSPVPDPDNDVDNDNNGQNIGLAFLGVASKPVTLDFGSEPTSEDDDPNTNLTVDFGFTAALAPPEPPPGSLTLGDRVWNDENRDASFDPGEEGIDGVRVELYRDINGNNEFDAFRDPFVAETTTSGGGRYAFGGLESGDYIVIIPLSNFVPGVGNFVPGGALHNFRPSAHAFFAVDPPDPDDNVDNDDNGYTDSFVVRIATVFSEAVTLSPGDEPIDDGDADPNTNLTVDFGFFFDPPPPSRPESSPPSLTVGNQVWHDEDGDGVIDFEAGIDGVRVELYRDRNCNNVWDAGDYFVAATTTSGGGLYAFGGLEPGDYLVIIPHSNFEPGGALEPFESSAVSNPDVPDPDDDVDDDNNGQPSIFAGAIRGVASQAVTLDIGAEPTDDGDGDPNTNLTVDFGFVTRQSAPKSQATGSSDASSSLTRDASTTSPARGSEADVQALALGAVMGEIGERESPLQPSEAPDALLTSTPQTLDPRTETLTVPPDSLRRQAAPSPLDPLPEGEVHILHAGPIDLALLDPDFGLLDDALLTDLARAWGVF